MHEDERINSRAQIVDHDAGAFGEVFQPSNGKWLPHIEDSEEYKAREKSFPSQWDGDQGDQLSRNFINDNKLRIFQAGSTRD